MAATRPKSIYRRGVLDSLPFIVMAAPFGAVFGVVATEAGLSVTETMGFSVLVIAGASQFAALQLMIDHAPIAVVVATALAVNLRMAMYSASLAPYLGRAPLGKRMLIAYFNVDQTFAMGSVKYETEPDLSVPDRVSYFAGLATPVMIAWYLSSLAGALFGQALPEAWSLEFAVPLAFLALTGPMLRSLAHVAAALTSIIMALVFAGLPYGSGLLLAGFAAMCAGALTETLVARAK